MSLASSKARCIVNCSSRAIIGVGTSALLLVFRLHRESQRKLLLACERLDGVNLGLGDLERVDPRDTDSRVVDMEHDPNCLGLAPVEDAAKDVDDEVARRV